MKGDYHLAWYNYIPAIIFYLITIFFTIGLLCSFAIDRRINIIIRIILLIIYLFILIFTIYYHYKSMMISNINDNDEYLLDSNENSKNYCNKCKKNRPNRSHHCKICGVCILKMDHHCPWIANCVGEKNEREFIYFLFGSTLGTLYVFLLTIKYFYSEFIKGNGANNKYNYYNNDFHETIKEIILCMKQGTCALSFVVGLFLILLTTNYIMKNVKYDITSIEMLIFRNFKDCPYYNDNLKDNFMKRIRPIPFFNNCLYELDDLKDEPKYKNFDEEVINLLNKEKET
jgi:palmitoyltransferase